MREPTWWVTLERGDLPYEPTAAQRMMRPTNNFCTTCGAALPVDVLVYEPRDACRCGSSGVTVQLSATAAGIGGCSAVLG